MFVSLLCFDLLGRHRKMLHDPRNYENPMTFNPERFLESPDKKPERDPRDICFGFGRRSVLSLFHSLIR